MNNHHSPSPDTTDTTSATATTCLVTPGSEQQIQEKSPLNSPDTKSIGLTSTTDTTTNFLDPIWTTPQPLQTSSERYTTFNHPYLRDTSQQPIDCMFPYPF